MSLKIKIDQSWKFAFPKSQRRALRKLKKIASKRYACSQYKGAINAQHVIDTIALNGIDGRAVLGVYRGRREILL